MDHTDSLGIWVVDMQPKLLEKIEDSQAILRKISLMLQIAVQLELSILVTEQYPVGLGPTVDEIKKYLPKQHHFYPKTQFSGYRDSEIRDVIEAMGVQTWVLMGIETHICVFQSAKDLLFQRKSVAVLNDATASRSRQDYLTALAELRESQVRITSTETLIYELIKDGASHAFKQVLPLIKASTY